MRTLLTAALVLLAACASVPDATISSSVADGVRIDGLSGEQVQLLNAGPGDLVFELQREKGPPQVVKIAERMSWSCSVEGLRSIIVTHKGEGTGNLRVTVHGRSGQGIRVVPLPKE